jgi:peptide subunit release factor 1 (eRF1)
MESNKPENMSRKEYYERIRYVFGCLNCGYKTETTAELKRCPNCNCTDEERISSLKRIDGFMHPPRPDRQEYIKDGKFVSR